MVFSNGSISAWMDEHPRAYINDENPVVPGERNIIEISDDDATDSEDGVYDREDLLDLLVRKVVIPTMTRRDYAERCYDSATAFIHDSISQIINAVNDACGPGFWATLTRSERALVFGAVFDQFPAFTMSRFRAAENEVVDFKEIFSKIRGRRDDEEKRKWQAYYRYTYVCMFEKTFMELELGEDGVREAWQFMNRRERVEEMELGGAYDLPAVKGLEFEKL
ncbi:hypothetical protein VTL71DRAFT_13555 [Oculimacula yallundae]|uniref:Uncharacterized protein n=1 Tax=Oculimacula yallundae TaxID=86028 RepID=A0ABR4CL83_9HELO